jgi:hypothetical protein
MRKVARMSPLRVCSLFAVLACFSPALHAAPILDQEHNFQSSVGNSTLGNVAEVGQTFTVGIAGTLDHVDVLMFRLDGIFDPTGDPILSIYNTSGGVPTGLPLTTATVPEASVPLNAATFVTFDISGASIPVNVGAVLAFSIRTNSSVGPYFLLVDGDLGQPQDYAPGAAVSRILNVPPDPWIVQTPASDHGFRTWVEPIPEPGTLVLLGVGLIGLIASFFRRDYCR